MNVLLKPELEKFVAEKIKAGQFADASDMVNEALKVLQEQEDFAPGEEDYLRREVMRGIEQLDRGETRNFNAETIIAEERQRLATRAEKR